MVIKKKEEEAMHISQFKPPPEMTFQNVSSAINITTSSTTKPSLTTTTTTMPSLTTTSSSLPASTPKPLTSNNNSTTTSGEFANNKIKEKDETSDKNVNEEDAAVDESAEEHEAKNWKEEEMNPAPDNNNQAPGPNDSTMESYEAQENVHSAVMMEPDAPTVAQASNCSASYVEDCEQTNSPSSSGSIEGEFTSAGESSHLLPGSAAEETSTTTATMERRAFKSSSDGGGGGGSLLADEIRKLRGQRNKLLLRPSMKRKRKRKRSNLDSNKKNAQNNNSATQLTRQSTTTSGYGALQDWPMGMGVASNQITSTIKQLVPTLANPLSLPSTVQKLIMSKFSQQQTSSGGNAARQPQTFASATNNPSQQAQIFYQPGAFAASDAPQLTHSDLIQQWAAANDVSASYAAAGARGTSKNNHPQGAAKLIPIEIIGLDPMITKSILETSSAALDTGQAADADAANLKMFTGNMAAESIYGGGSDPTLKQVVGPQQRPLPSSIVHIHHFHTQAKAAAAAAAAAKLQQQQQQQLQQQQQQPDESSSGMQENGGGSSPDMHSVNAQKLSQAMESMSNNGNKQQAVAGQQQQQVYVNDRGELVYLTPAGDDQTAQVNSGSAAAAAPADSQVADQAAGNSNEQQSPQYPTHNQQPLATGGEQQQQQQVEQSSGEQTNSLDHIQRQRLQPAQAGGGGSEFSTHDKIAGESVNPVHQAAAIQSSQQQFAPPIRHEGHNHSTTYFMHHHQPMRSQQVLGAPLGFLANHDPSQQRQRVYLTTNGQTISLVSGLQQQQQPHNIIGDRLEMGADKKLLMVAYKPQLQLGFQGGQLRNASSSGDQLINGRNPYNEGQESKASLISAGAHQLLRGANFLAGSGAALPHHQQVPGPLVFDQFDSDLAITRPHHANGSSLDQASWSKSLQVGETLSERAKINNQLLAGPQPVLDTNHRVPSLAGSFLATSNATGKANQQQEPVNSFRATWLEPASDSLGKPSQSQSNFGFQTGSGGEGNNTAYESGGANSTGQLPAQVINLLRLSANSTSKLTNDELLRRLMQEIRLRNGLVPVGAAGHQHHLNSNGVFHSDPSNRNYTTSANDLHQLVAGPRQFAIGGQQVAPPGNASNFNRNSLNGFHLPMQKIVNNPGSPIMMTKDHQQTINKLDNVIIEPHELHGPGHSHHHNHHHHHMKHRGQPAVGVAGLEESGGESFGGDTTNGLSNMALAFIFVVSLITLTIIAASMIYRYRRRSIGRCADLPASKSSNRLNITQRTKRFVRSNFSGPNHHEAASIKSINLDLGGGGAGTTNTLTGGANRKADGSSHCRLAGDRYTAKQAFGSQGPMSTFNGATLTGSPGQFGQDSDSAMAAAAPPPPPTDIKMLNGKFQKSNYLKSMISSPSSECLAAAAGQTSGAKKQHLHHHNHHHHQHHPHSQQQQQQQQQQQLLLNRPAKPRSDPSSCYLDIRHAMDEPSQKARLPLNASKCKNNDVAEHGERRSSNAGGDSYHQNYSFAIKTPHGLDHQQHRYQVDRTCTSSLDSRDRQSTNQRMSTIHSQEDESETTKSTIGRVSGGHHQHRLASSNEQPTSSNQFRRHSNISYRAGKLNNLMQASSSHPKHMATPGPGETGGSPNELDHSSSRTSRPTEFAQLDRL